MCGGPIYRAFLVTAGLAGVLACGSDLAVAQSGVGGTTPTVVLRGSTAAVDGVAGTSSPPIVLRGSPPPPAPAAQAPPAADTPCPAGYIPGSSAGCVPSGNAFEPYDYDWLLAYPLLEARQQPARRFVSGRGRRFHGSIARPSPFDRTGGVGHR
jgi:hypothetical protein